MHALEHEAARLVLEGDDALAAQYVRPVALGQLVEPGHEARRIDLALVPDRHRLHFFIVIGLERRVFLAAVMIMMLVMTVAVSGGMIDALIVLVAVMVVVIGVMVIVVVVRVIMLFGVEENSARSPKCARDRRRCCSSTAFSGTSAFIARCSVA